MLIDPFLVIDDVMDDRVIEMACHLNDCMGHDCDLTEDGLFDCVRIGVDPNIQYLCKSCKISSLGRTTGGSMKGVKSWSDRVSIKWVYFWEGTERMTVRGKASKLNEWVGSGNWMSHRDSGKSMRWLNNPAW